MMSKNYRTTIRLPKAMRQEMHESIIAKGYGLRGKSTWISEAIENLLIIDDFHQLVNMADEMSNLTETEVVYLTQPIKDKLDEALIDVRKVYPMLEGVQSSIIRTSIIQRLLRD